jgi:hypothetical protein
MKVENSNREYTKELPDLLHLFKFAMHTVIFEFLIQNSPSTTDAHGTRIWLARAERLEPA